MYKTSLSQMDSLMLWKESIIVPLAKVPSSKGLSNYRPVALTSLVIEGLEKNVKRSLLAMSQSETILIIVLFYVLDCVNSCCKPNCLKTKIFNLKFLP